MNNSSFRMPQNNMCMEYCVVIIPCMTTTKAVKRITHQTICYLFFRVPFLKGTVLELLCANLSVSLLTLVSGNKIISRKYTVHVPLSQFGHLMGIVEDVFHFLMECVETKTVRQTLVIRFKLNIVDIAMFQSILSKSLSVAALLVCGLFEVWSVTQCFANKFIFLF